MWIWRLLGVTLATLSLAKLVSYGLMAKSIAEPLQLALHWYEAFLSVLFDWAEPYLLRFARFALQWLDYDITIHSHWKHVFVLIWLYAGTQARNAWDSGLRTFAAYRAVMGGTIGALTGAMTGAVPLGGDYAIVVLPLAAVLGVALYQLSNTAWILLIWKGQPETWWPGMHYNYAHPFNYLIVGVPLSLASLLFKYVPVTRDLPNAGALTLIALIVLLALYWLWQGGIWSLRDKRSDQTRTEAFLNAPTTRQGLLLIYTVLGVALFVVTNAGLLLLGSL